MKTTLDIPDDLLIEAKAVAARRRTTLKEMVTHALRREIMPVPEPTPEESAYLEVGPLGILRLKKRKSELSREAIRSIEDKTDDAETESALKRRRR